MVSPKEIACYRYVHRTVEKGAEGRRAPEDCHIFDRSLMVSSRSHRNIMYLYRDYSASTSHGKGEGVDEESNKNWHRKERVLLGFT